MHNKLRLDRDIQFMVIDELYDIEQKLISQSNALIVLVEEKSISGQDRRGLVVGRVANNMVLFLGEPEEISDVGCDRILNGEYIGWTDGRRYISQYGPSDGMVENKLSMSREQFCALDWSYGGLWGKSIKDICDNVNIMIPTLVE